MQVYNSSAILKGFDRSYCVNSVNEQEARIKSGSVFSKAKVSFTIFRRIEQINRAALNTGFFIAVLHTKVMNSQGGCVEEKPEIICSVLEGARGLKPKYPPTSHKKSNDTLGTAQVLIGGMGYRIQSDLQRVQIRERLRNGDMDRLLLTLL